MKRRYPEGVAHAAKRPAKGGSESHNFQDVWFKYHKPYDAIGLVRVLYSSMMKDRLENLIEMEEEGDGEDDE